MEGGKYMSTISFGGLATGLDTQSIITQLMNLERVPEQLLQAQQKTNTGKISEFQKIEDALTSLQDVVQGFNTPGTFNAVKSTVGNSSALSATATSSATQGTHTVQVISLAKFQRQVSTGVASDTALSFGTGSFTIDGGAPISIAAGQNSLQGIVAAINSSGAKVTASVINDGTNYRMVISGTDTQNHAFDFSGLGAAPTLLGSGDPTYQDAAPAQLVVDGVNMTKTSNTVTDAIQGVTLNLLTEGLTTSVSITNDTDAVTQKINNFVTAYNKVITLINSESTYNADTKTAGVLSGNITVRTIQQQFQSLLTTTVSGTSGTFKTLAALGINSDSKTGTLSVNSTKLSDALTNHYSDVVDYFTHNGDSVTTLATNKYGIAQQFNLVIEAMVHPYIADGMADNGIIEVAKKALTNRNADIDKQISDMEYHITQMQTNLQKQFNAMELMVSNLQSQGNMLLSILGTTTSTTSKTSG
jgi:flagellar hook-associated protein 2